jgi:cytochrome c biogenesis protein CcmG/thiol:disulfide interchange protein DsbE
MAGRAHRQGGNLKIVALFLVGAGLLVLGMAAFFMLPRPDAAASDERSAIPLSVEYPAPELELTDLEGKAVSLADYLGQVVLVNNWATWCPPCKAEMPTLQAYYEDHAGKGFTIIAIDAGDPVSDVAKFVKDYGLSFPVWPDLTQKATVAFRNPGLPSSYLIDRQGAVRLAWTGAISRGMLDKYVTPLLEE